ncbi:MAG: hypothetical protein IJO55_09645 [Lachnospiraceae bacterium]|nr:hypothetical protein [Lachnospiraceae bacterium]
MEKKTSLAVKYQNILENLGNQQTFYFDEVEKLFPDMKKTYLYWVLSKLVEEGYLKRIRNGVYAFNEWREKKSISISTDAQKIRDVLDETGFDYYISGVDVLQKYMQHVPEQYPVMLFIEKEAKEEIKSILKSNGFDSVDAIQTKEMYERYSFTGTDTSWVILYQTESFEFAEDGVATIEKAFVDLFYAVSRNGYPLALQELVRVYENLVRLGSIDQKRMITVATRRGIQYDIRYIVESKFITENAKRFVELLRRGA